MLHIKYLTAISLVSLSFQALSFTLPDGYLVVQGGGFWSTVGKDQHININTLIGDQYTVSKRNDNNGLFGLGYFFTSPRIQTFTMNYGINAFYLPKIYDKGTIVQENLFENLGYSYGIRQVPVYAAAKALMNYSEQLSFTADIGIGPNFIQTSRVEEWSINNSNSLPNNAFFGKNSTEFSAMAGIGLRLNNKLYKEVGMEVGYRYFYLGKGSFQKRNDEWLNTLTTGNNHAHAVVVSLIF